MEWESTRNIENKAKPTTIYKNNEMKKEITKTKYVFFSECKMLLN